VILTAGSAYIFSKGQTPIYRAEQKIMIKPARTDLGLQEAMRNSMNSYAARINTQLRAAEAIDALKLDMTPDQLFQKVKATASLDDLLIIIDVDLTDGEVANRVAAVYGQKFKEWRDQENASQQLADRVNAELLDAPKYVQYSPNTTVNVIAGALLGVLVGGVVVFVLEFVESNVVRSAADVERYLQLQVLGNLPATE
ncbi:MAG TPA: hypothetical protein VMT34_16385, partial [Aggregatilineales bacterium]|nr:hypothetical protein [Aggregatilineales bacterium]